MTDARQQGQHPSVDLIADLQEGLVPAEQAVALNAHLASCAECHAVRASLDDVSRLLADEAQTPVPMPEQVAARLDATLRQAQAEREAGVPSLAERRTTQRHTPADRPSRKPRWIPLAGAAAVVVVAGVVGVPLLTDGGGEESAQTAQEGQAPSNDTSAGGDAQGGDPGAQGDGEAAAPDERPDADDVPRNGALREAERRGARELGTDDLTTYAEQLTEGVVREVTPTGTCRPVARQYSAATVDSITSLVVWEGDPAVYVVDPKARQATLLACGAAFEVLKRVDY